MHSPLIRSTVMCLSHRLPDSRLLARQMSLVVPTVSLGGLESHLWSVSGVRFSQVHVGAEG